MTEPTVLDYVKSIFKDWKSFTTFLQAWTHRADMTQLVETSAQEGEPSVPATEDSSFISRLLSFPWCSILALLLALLAQRFLEPPTRSAPMGVSLYLAALALLIWAFIRNEWTPAPLPASQTNADPLSVRMLELILALCLGAAAFATLTENTFTLLNVTLWALSVALFIRAFWLKEPQRLWKQASSFLFQPEWNVHITRWGLLAFAVVVLAIAFRFNRLADVAPEMTSDHAEKLMDVFDITQGKYSIYFPRNTGREPLYIYLSALLTPIFGISFLDIKVAAVIGGLLMLPYLYLLGKELGSERIGLLAVAFAAIAYWPGVIERFALRISFYPLFVAPTLYYLIRGLRRQSRNDFILAGVALGLGLNGYMPFRIMPFAVVIIVGVYLLHVRDALVRKQVVLWLGLLALTSFMIFIPLARYAVDEPDMFGYRAFTRLGSVERPLPGTVPELFFGNLWNAAKQFNWDDGEIWVHSIPHRPALDIIAASLFLLGVFLVLARYLRSRHWTDLVLLLAIPLTQMPSILSLAFPSENPSLNRAAGAIVPAFLFVGVALDSLMTALGQGKKRNVIAWGLAGMLFVISFQQNYNLIFNVYREQYANSAWNTSEMGAVMKDAIARGVPLDNVWIVPYPYWVDTRLAPIWAGAPGRDIAVFRENLPSTLDFVGPKVFMIERDDVETIALLQALYPLGDLTLYESAIDPHDFWIYRVP